MAGHSKCTNIRHKKGTAYASAARKILGLKDALENNDDAQNVYSNHEIYEETLEQPTS